MSDAVLSCRVETEGRLLDAALSVGSHADGRLFVVLESRSGTKGSGRQRNPDYIPALEVVLRRLGSTEAVIEDISVVSQPAMKLAPRKRRLPMRFPISLKPSDNFHAIRLNITEKQRETARTTKATDAAGGNNTKRICITIGRWNLSGSAAALKQALEAE